MVVKFYRKLNIIRNLAKIKFNQISLNFDNSTITKPNQMNKNNSWYLKNFNFKENILFFREFLN